MVELLRVRDVVSVSQGDGGTFETITTANEAGKSFAFKDLSTQTPLCSWCQCVMYDPCDLLLPALNLVRLTIYIEMLCVCVCT